MKRPLVLAAAGLMAVSLNAAPATAADYDVKVSKKSGLSGKKSVSVTISGLPKTVGVYVRLCKKPAKGQRPAAEDCYGGSDRSGVWAIQKYPYPGERAEGSVNPKKGPFKLAIAKKFGDVDCKTSKCVVFIRRDHQGGGDFSYDRSIRLRFNK